MDEFEVSYALDTEAQFWEELEEILLVKCQNSHQLIDNTLRTYLHFTTNFKDEYLQSEDALERCLRSLLRCEVFCANKDYVRIQLVYSLLQEDEPGALFIISSLLVMDGRENEKTFEMMNNEGSFPRLIELIKEGKYDDTRLHRLLMELLYEMSRIHRLTHDDLKRVDDDFIQYLFQIIEELSDDVNDPYHYPVIRILLVLNEQYMVAATTAPDASPTSPSLTNRVIKILGIHGQLYKTFGENIILLLNRETETSLQLLILKLLYLLFTTKATHEYFYTNDLRVLLDVIIRNLLDLPNELDSLRHTYLRVLYPLLGYTQLSQPPHYKRDEIIKVLSILGGSTNAHFAPADETTVRLVDRVAQVSWLRDEDDTKNDFARKLLGISLSSNEITSSISVVDVAAVMEKPGVQTPSRTADRAGGAVVEQASKESGMDEKVVKPPPPPVSRQRRPPPEIPTLKVNGHKKLPPKAPPRRRTRLRSTAGLEDNKENN